MTALTLPFPDVASAEVAVRSGWAVFTARPGVNDPVTGLFDAIYAEAERSRG